MKILEKLVLIMYSLIMLIISGLLCLIIFRIIGIEDVENFFKYILENTGITIITLAICVSFIILSVRCLFFRKRKQIKKSTETDILLENDSGRLLISKRAIENCIKNIVIENVETKPDIEVVVDIDPATNVSAYISVVLDKSIKVRDFTLGLQEKIKCRIKENFDIDVKQINIKIDSSEKVEIKKELQKNQKKTIDENSKEVIEVDSNKE